MATLKMELAALELLMEDVDKHLLVFEDSPTLLRLKKMMEFMRKSLIFEAEVNND